MKHSLFYFIYLSNSNSRENLVIFLRDFHAFCRFLNSSSAYSVTGETVETTTDQRNWSIIGSDDVYIS